MKRKAKRPIRRERLDEVPTLILFRPPGGVNARMIRMPTRMPQIPCRGQGADASIPLAKVQRKPRRTARIPIHDVGRPAQPVALVGIDHQCRLPLEPL